MTSARKANAEAVLTQLRAVGPQTAAEIQQDLGLTKREVESALHQLLGASVEYDYPTRSPLVYKVAL
jgi:hypothetical protein